MGKLAGPNVAPTHTLTVWGSEQLNKNAVHSYGQRMGFSSSIQRGRLFLTKTDSAVSW